MGAIASGGVHALNQDVLWALGISRGVVDLVAEREQHELLRREREYRDGRAPVDIRNRTVILVDDGLATGSSMRVAATALKQQGPAEIIAAVPVGAPETCAEFESEVDKVVCATIPEPFRAVGEWYRDFSQTSDEEVRDLLSEAAKLTAPGRI